MDLEKLFTVGVDLGGGRIIPYWIIGIAVLIVIVVLLVRRDINRGAN